MMSTDKMTTSTMAIKLGNSNRKRKDGAIKAPHRKTDKKEKSSTKKSAKADHAELGGCVVECGHDTTSKDHREHSTQHLIDRGAMPIATPSPEQKELNRVLEAGLMINGLRVLYLALAEKIEVHVSHNVITPELLRELEDVAASTQLTTKRLNALKVPCCDLYTQLAPSEEGDDD